MNLPAGIYKNGVPLAVKAAAVAQLLNPRSAADGADNYVTESSFVGGFNGL